MSDDCKQANETHAPCPTHSGQWHNKSTGDCSCGARHRYWARMDSDEAGAHTYPYVIVDWAGRACDRYGSSDTAYYYLGEYPKDQGFEVIFDDKPRELSRRLDLP